MPSPRDADAAHDRQRDAARGGAPAAATIAAAHDRDAPAPWLARRHRRLRRRRGQVGDEPLELGIGRRAVGDLDALRELVEGQAAVLGAVAQIVTVRSRSASEARRAGDLSSGGPSLPTRDQSS